jgi:soluble lytic murein transglycosylase
VEDPIALRRGDWKQVRATIRAMPAIVARRAGLDLLAGPRLAWPRAGRSRCAGAVPPHRRPEQFSTASWRWKNSASRSRFRRAGAASRRRAGAGGANPGLQTRAEILRLRLRFEGTREWNWALRNFTERQLLVAAEFARQNEILDRMVNTSERTRTEFDYTQRFPSPHNDILHPTAQAWAWTRPGCMA